LVPPVWSVPPDDGVELDGVCVAELGGGGVLDWDAVPEDWEGPDGVDTLGVPDWLDRPTSPATVPWPTVLGIVTRGVASYDGVV
jgi:hypothetical protein